MIKLNNKGFISVTTIISFVVLFVTLLVTIMATYTNNRIIFNIYKNDIKNVLYIKFYNQNEVQDNGILKDYTFNNLENVKYKINQLKYSFGGTTTFTITYYCSSITCDAGKKLNNIIVYTPISNNVEIITDDVCKCTTEAE